MSLNIEPLQECTNTFQQAADIVTEAIKSVPKDLSRAFSLALIQTTSASLFFVGGLAIVHEIKRAENDWRYKRLAAGASFMAVSGLTFAYSNQLNNLFFPKIIE